MTGPSVAIVVTSINDGQFLKAYAKALEGADATMYVIPDRKTPDAIYAAAGACADGGLRIACPHPVTQDAFLKRLGAPEGMFPWDTDHRRNVGYLMAYESGADIVISVDDDNLPVENWLTLHAEAFEGGKAELVVSNPDRFWNPCRLLWDPPAFAVAPYWPRGYPYSARQPGFADEQEYGMPHVAINAGLWLGEPDVDAITRLALRPQAYGAEMPGRVLAAGTWAPVNSQNTAVRREVIPAYYFFRSPRFGDIYQGYLAQACAKALGHSVRFGTPVVRHERNEHDLLRDLEAELPDILVLDRWLDWLTAAKPEGSTYAEAYESLARQMFMASTRWDDHAWVARAQQMTLEMRSWLKLCKRIDGC